MVSDDTVDRRAFLRKAGATTGVVATGSIAGCTGGGEGDDGGDGGNGDDGGSGTGEALPEFTYYNNPQNYNPGRHDAINLISEQWNQVGFEIEVEVLEWATLLSAVSDEYDFDISTWSQYFGVDPGEGVAERFSSENADEPGTGNYHGYKDETMDELINDQLIAEDIDTRAEAFHEIQKKVAEEVPMFPVLTESNMMPHRNDHFSGWVDHIEGYNRLTNYVNVSVEDGNEDGVMRGFWTESLENLSAFAHEGLSKHLHLFDAMYDKPIHLTPELEVDTELSLAEEVERPDLETMVLTIREDAEWNDGEPLTAEDVAFTYETIMNEAVPQNSQQANYLDDVELVDETTVELSLSTEMGVAANAIMGNTVFVAPKHEWEGVSNPSEELIEEPVTSGIMELDYWNPGEEVRLTARDDHRLDFEVEGMYWRIIPSQSTIWELTRQGDINYHPFAQASENLADNEEEEDNIEVAKTEGNGWTHINFNMRNAGLDEQTVRQAMAHAVPKTTINEQLYNGYHEPGAGYITPSFGPLYTDDIMMYDESVESAVGTLEDAGFSVSDDGVYYPE